MNVNPVTAPGPASVGEVTARAKSQQVSASSASRGDVRERSAALAAEQDSSHPNTVADQTIDPSDADRQKAERLRAFISDNNMRLSTYHDEASGRSILEVRDQTTGDVVSQYPSEELIRLYAALRQTLVDQSA